MKRISLNWERVARTAAAAIVSIVCASQAGTYGVDWSSVQRGGGTSTAGVYRITATIGQADATKANSANYGLQGGFWSYVAAIQEPGAPMLGVRVTETNTVVVSWPVDRPGWVLLETTDVSGDTWTPVTPAPIIVVTGKDQAQKHVVLPKPAGARFFRLRKPGA